MRLACWENFLEKLGRLGTQSPETRRLYAEGALRFLKLYGFTPETADSFIERVKSGEIDPYEALDRFIGSLGGLAPNTVSVFLHGAKKFLVLNGVKIERDVLRERVVAPKARVTNVDRIPTYDELRRLYYLANFEQRVLLVLLVSSGMRIGEAIKVRVSDLHLDEDPPYITLKPEYCKGRRGRIVLVTQECVELLKEYIQQKRLKKEDRLFNMSRIAAIKRIQRLFRKGGLNERGGKWFMLRSHCLRKYFRTALAASGVQDAFIHMLMGHRAYLDESYFRANLEMVKEQYNRAVDKLTLGRAPSESRESKVMKMIQTLGLDPKEVFEVLKSRFHFEIGREVEAVGESRAASIIEVLYLMCPEEVEEAIRSLIRRRERADCNGGGRGGYIIVKGEEELLAKLEEGYELIKELTNNRFLLRAP